MSYHQPRHNNNYLPFQSSHLAPSRSLSPSAQLGVNNNMYIPSNHFTFGSPTQSSVITSSHQQSSTAPRAIYQRQMSAPGIGTSWQHTVPTQMPWCEPSTVVQFTSSQIMSVPKSSMSSSSSRCSTSSHHQPKRRPPRHDDEASPVKQHISEEKMAARMQGLYIGNSPTKENSSTNRGWDKFLDLEERLKDEDIEDVSKKRKSTIIISSDYKDSIFKPNLILPSQLINRLHKPSLELVLWKPPEGVVSEIISKVKEEESVISPHIDSNNMQDRSFPRHKPSLELVLWKPPEGVVSEIISKVKEEESVISPHIDSNNMQDRSFPRVPSSSDMEVDCFDCVDDEMTL